MMHPVVYFAAACTKNFFLFLPPWWEYLKTSTDALGQCSINIAGSDGFQLTDILPIGLAFLDILLRLAGFVAVVSIIVAGASHFFTGGNPEKASAARHRLYNSIIGLIIALMATTFVSFAGRQIGGSGSSTQTPTGITVNIPRADNSNVIKTVMVDAFVIIGALAFLMVIFGGLRYILSRGNPDKITTAKNIILYSLVGLVIAALAGTIVNIVLSRFG